MSGGSPRGLPLELRERAVRGREITVSTIQVGSASVAVYLVLAARGAVRSGIARAQVVPARPGTTTEKIPLS